MDVWTKRRIDGFSHIIEEASETFRIRPELIRAIIAVESSGFPNAKAKTTSASGLMQLTKAAAQDMGMPWEKRFDPWENIMAGAGYLAMMIHKNGNNEYRGVMAYYAGHGTINDGKETQLDKDATQYAEKVFFNVARDQCLSLT